MCTAPRSGHSASKTRVNALKGGPSANKPPRWSAERRASPGAQTVKANLRGDVRASDLALRAYDTGPPKGCLASTRAPIGAPPPHFCEGEKIKARRRAPLARTMTLAWPRPLILILRAAR
jgi:hypothetical protein